MDHKTFLVTFICDIITQPNLNLICSDEGDTSSSSSESGAIRGSLEVMQPAPPSSPILPNINRDITDVSEKRLIAMFDLVKPIGKI